MTKLRIYTAGPIAGCDYGTAAMGWRAEVKKALEDIADIYSPMRGKGYLKEVGIIDSVSYPQPLSTDRAIVGRDIYDVSNSDLIFANFIDCPKFEGTDIERGSLGSAGEYGVAYYCHIPIITCMKKGGIHDHPFIRGMSSYIVDDLQAGIAIARILLTPGL